MSNDPTRAPRRPFHKRQMIVDKSFQYRLIGTLLAFWSANALFFVLLQHFLYRGHLKAFYALVPRDGMVPLMGFDSLLDLSVVFITVFGAIVLTLIATYLSNQIAGPLYRAKVAIARVAEGDWNVSLRFRETDFLQDYPEAFNALVESLRRSAEEDLRELDLLAAAAGEHEEVRASIDRLRARLEARVRDTVSSRPEPEEHRETTALVTA